MAHTMIINDKAETRCILDGLPPANNPRLMIQVGASEGNLARSFAKNGWIVHAFDAAPIYKAAEDLARSEANPNYNFYNMAISLRDEDTVTFFVHRTHPTISSLRKYRDEHEPQEVPAITLEKFYRRNNITAIDFFMIDAETMDLEIMKTHDWNVPISALMMEVTPRNIMDIYTYVTGQNSGYRHVVFDWRKPYRGEVMGECRQMCTAQEFAEAPRDGTAFGDILFYV